MLTKLKVNVVELDADHMLVVMVDTDKPGQGHLLTITETEDLIAELSYALKIARANMGRPLHDYGNGFKAYAPPSTTARDNPFHS